MRAALLSAGLALALLAPARGSGLGAPDLKPDPKERNKRLKKSLKAVKGKVTELEAKQKEAQDKVTENQKAKTAAMDAFQGEKEKLEADLEALKKEHQEKTDKCNAEYQEAQASAKTAVMDGIKTVTSSLLNSKTKNSKRREDPPEEEDQEKMKYIEENKVLERKLAKSKADFQSASIQIKKYEAALKKSDVGTKHLNKIIEQMKDVYAAQTKSLKAGIAILDKRCKLAEDLKAAAPKMKANLGR